MPENARMFGIQREKYLAAMADNLPMLRVKLGMSQTDLAEFLGVTRQTISAVESKARPISWSGFLSLLLLFMQNQETRVLLPVLGIYTEELAEVFGITDLNKLK